MVVNRAERKVRFFNLKYCYLTSESIVIDLHYANDFLFIEGDWIAILPAGYLDAKHFAALKMAPAKTLYSNIDKQLFENVNKKKNNFCPKLNGNRFGELHKIVFRASETKVSGLFIFYAILYNAKMLNKLTANRF